MGKGLWNTGKLETGNKQHGQAIVMGRKARVNDISLHFALDKVSRHLWLGSIFGRERAAVEVMRFDR
jgi:D-serine dehydratase